MRVTVMDVDMYVWMGELVIDTVGWVTVGC